MELDLVIDIALDVYFPTGESGGEPGVLPFSAYCEGELPVRHDRHCRFVVVIQFDFHYLRRAQGVGDENGDFLVPLHDINLLAVQFVDNVLNADAAQPDARAYRVHAVLPGAHCNLAA